MQFLNKIIGKKEGLENKWWHRLIKVVFILFLVFFLGFCFLISSNSVNKNSQNSIITGNLRDFTLSSSNTSNTIPDFLKLDGELACYKRDLNDFKYLAEYDLEQYAYCNPDLVSNVDEAVSFINQQYPQAKYTREQILKHLNDKLGQTGEKELCLHKVDEIDCKSGDIIKYKVSYLFYLQIFLWSVIPVIILWFLGLVVYYRVVIYIMYGGKKIK